jgi:hypothetical protein
MFLAYGVSQAGDGADPIHVAIIEEELAGEDHTLVEYEP